MSRSTDPVTRDAHERWYAAALADPNRIVMIGQNDGRDIGVVRFDVSGDHAEISLNLAPEARGHGLSVPLLKAAIDAFLSQTSAAIVAELRSDNTASRRAFEAAGFRRVGQTGDMLRYGLEPG